MIPLEKALHCNSIEDLDAIAKEYKFYFFWQKQTPEFVYTYDKMPEGFFEQYYGGDIDLRCPIAWAFRSRQWPVFTFQQAFNDPRFSQLDPNLDSKNFWINNVIKDGLLILSGRPGLDSFAAFGFSRKIDNPQKEALPYIALTHKMDDWLQNNKYLTSTSRKFSMLSQKESDTLKLQINFPHLSIREQASQLGISELTLQSRHERIAKKFGVKRFAGAAILAERTGFFSLH